ncbi:MAG: NADH-quinone oxidoreductase subunit N [Bacteroidetes bacterium]|nr:NADH-quinone oxidoreductase subunit N [Bacteroidota bacterium]
MNTLIYTSLLGVGCLVVEMLNQRKLVLPFAVVGLLAILGMNIQTWGLNQSFYHNMVLSDNFSEAFSSLLIFLTILILVLANDFFRNEASKISDYVSILVFTLSGAIAMVSFGNMAMFFLGLEVLSISLYILAGSKRKDIRSNEAGMKYFLMGSFASGVLLFGIALIYGETGSFDIARIGNYVHNTMPSILFYIGAGMILVAMLFKVSAVPFHFWAPDVYDGSPTLVTIMMVSVTKIAAFAGFYRLFSECFSTTLPLYGLALSIITALTMIVGNFTALHQNSFKRLLAYSGISHAGYMMLGIISLSGKTDESIFYYAVAYGIASIAAFATAIVVAESTGSDNIDSFNGLGKKNPFLAVALTISILSMAGIPPLAGFFGKYYIFSEAIRNGHIILTIIAIINSMVGVYYYFKVMIAMFTEGDNGSTIRVPASYLIIIGFCALLVILFGIFPSVILSLI